MDKGMKLKELRERKQMSQTDAARHIGVSKQTLYKYENNIVTNIPYDIIERIATLYETSPAYLMGWDDEEDKKIPTYLYESDRELLERYHSLSPETRKSIDLLIEADLQRNGSRR